MENPRPDILLTLYEEEQDLIKKLQALRELIIAFGGQPTESFGKRPLFRPLRVPPQWDKSMSKIQKITYAIKELGGSATSSQIADKIHELESSLEWMLGAPMDQNNKRNIIMLVSYLHKNGRLKVKKEGGKHIFSLE